MYSFRYKYNVIIYRNNNNRDATPYYLRNKGKEENYDEKRGESSSLTKCLSYKGLRGG